FQEKQSGKLEVNVSGRLLSPVEWYKDNNRIKESAKFKIVSTPTGMHTLFINGAAQNDSGLYKCMMKSEGGAVENLWRVTVKSPVSYPQKQQFGRPMEPQKAAPPMMKIAGVKAPTANEGMSASTVELAKLKQVEKQQAARQANKPLQEKNLTPSTQAPTFTGCLKELSNLVEGQTAHFECSVAPANDANLKVVWLFNGRPLQENSRIFSSFSNGVATLDINKVHVKDIGTYTCLAVNQLGQQRSSASLNIDRSKAGDLSANGFKENGQQQGGDQKRRKMESAGASRPELPNFSSEFRNLETYEGKPVRFEAKLSPANDPQMKLEWFFNGNPLQMGNRIKTGYNFGFVTLDIIQCSPQDSGSYTCRATNSLGVAETNGVLFCQGVSAVAPGSQWADQNEWGSDEVAVHNAPKFVSPLQNQEVDERGRCFFEARVIPRNDPHLQVEWYKDGLPLQMANRIQVLHSFGFVSLVIAPAYPEDSGVYTCMAKNRVGQDQTQAQLVCHGKDSLVLDTQHEGALAPINQLDSYRVHIGPVLEERPEELHSTRHPKFTTHPAAQVHANQEEPVHFECRIQPANDPKLKVEWFKDRAPLCLGHRIRPSYDFGRVCLDILYAYPEDTGTYNAVATNEIGQDVTQCALIVQGRQSLYLDPQHPEGLQRIQELEAARPLESEKVTDACEGAPKLSGQLQNQILKEGTNLYLSFQVHPANDPTMKIDWYLNGQLIITGSRVTTRNEFGHVILHVQSVISEDSGEYVAHIYNEKGETTAFCNVTVE
uniref:Ig-like domain-containing protein n=1 Tax=Romanomermis culicivorax TaxID=13658 RepID=A0A915LAH8_ROMCU